MTVRCIVPCVSYYLCVLAPQETSKHLTNLNRVNFRLEFDRRGAGRERVHRVARHRRQSGIRSTFREGQAVQVGRRRRQLSPRTQVGQKQGDQVWRKKSPNLTKMAKI